jgi:hypothetical protein
MTISLEKIDQADKEGKLGFGIILVLVSVVKQESKNYIFFPLWQISLKV